jgi:hypothetical protein
MIYLFWPYLESQPTLGHNTVIRDRLKTFKDRNQDLQIIEVVRKLTLIQFKNKTATDR